jgi:AcrR family transcriptional regulator
MIRSVFFYFRDRKKRQLEMVHEYQERLRTIIMELLAKADEVDQQSKYLGVPSTEWAEELRRACSDLVKLGDRLPEIERLIEEENIRGAREAVLESCRKAVQISRQLDHVRQDEHRRKS